MTELFIEKSLKIVGITNRLIQDFAFGHENALRSLVT